MAQSAPVARLIFHRQGGSTCAGQAAQTGPEYSCRLLRETFNIPVCRVHTLCTPPSFRLPSARCNTPICSLDGAFSLHSTNGRKQKSRQKALLPRHSGGYRVQNKNASIVSILTFLYGGDGEIRTLEELLTLTRFPIVRARPTTRHLHGCSKTYNIKLSAWTL